MTTLKTFLANDKIHLTSCLYNASGPKCTSEDELLNLFLSSAGAVLSKSCTLEPRDGNPGIRYWDSSDDFSRTDLISVNSMGLPNNGYKFYIDMIPKLYQKSQYSSIRKPYIISVAGLSLADNLKIIKDINKSKKQYHNLINIGIELNLSCPNIIGKGQLAYDFDALEKYLAVIFALDLSYIDIFGIKLPPYFELSHFESVAQIIRKFPINFITTINSIGNGMVIDPETDKPVIEPKGGLGGLGGTLVKPTTLANIYNFKKVLPNIDIIGCGGVTCGRDAYEHILCGASAVQIGTQYMVENTKCFDRISNELLDIMESKNYKNINEFKGKIIQ